jgi:hypothetical protein
MTRFKDRVPFAIIPLLSGGQHACHVEGLPHFRTHFDSRSIVAGSAHGTNQLQPKSYENNGDGKGQADYN